MPSLWVFDLDGTLIDVEARYRHIHAELIGAGGGRADPAYWAKKRDKTPEADIARGCGLSPADADAYALARLPLLEDGRYLAHDSVFPGVRALLDRVGRDRAVLVTKRRDRSALERQLERLGLATCFANVLTPAPGAEKATLVAAIRDLAGGAGRIVSVSDSPQDLIDAKAAGFVAVAVLSGLRSRRLIEPTRPDVIVGSITELSLEEIEDVSPL